MSDRRTTPVARQRIRVRCRGAVPDVIAPGLDALFVGINPGFISAREGHHFANPANPFWTLLHESGFGGSAPRAR